MATPNRIWTKARGDLIVVEEPDCQDCVLWEHSERIAHSAEHIAKHLLAKRYKIDFHALTAAALYHDSGWVVQYRDGVVERRAILCKPTTNAQRVLGASFLENQLSSILKAESLELAAECVRRLNDRDLDRPEGLAISDAENLDQIGTLSLWATVRRHIHEGRGVQHFLEVWQRQQEYHYWDAWINDSFRFEAVRALARRRLATLGRFIDELADTHASRDLASLIDSAPADASFPPVQFP